MRSSEGGPGDTPRRKLPPPMWQREPEDTKVRCRLCKAEKKMVEGRHDDHIGYYLICPVCDAK